MPNTERAVRLELVTAHSAAVAPLPPENTALLADQGRCFAASSSVKLSKNATASRWRNSESSVSNVVMYFAARARMRGAHRSQVFRNRPDSDCNPPTQTRTKRETSSNQRKWDAPCSQTASPVHKTIITEMSPPNLPYPVHAQHSCLVLSNHQKSILHTSMVRTLFHADS